MAQLSGSMTKTNPERQIKSVKQFRRSSADSERNETYRAKQGLNKAHRRHWDDPRGMTPCRPGTDVP